jgi:predicted PurR-regulated permease PerM
LKIFDTKTVQVLNTVLVFVVVLLFFYAAWRAIITFLFAIFFAYLLEGPVDRLQPWLKGSRSAAIIVVYLVLIGGLTTVFFVAGPSIGGEAQKLAQQAPKWSSQISSGTIAHEVGERRGWSAETQKRIEDFLQTHRQEFITAAQNFVLRAVRTVQNLWWLFLVPILAIFFLKDGRKLVDLVIESVRGKKNQQILAATLAEMNTMLGGYLRAQMALATLAMVVITLVMWAMGAPYPFAVGPAAGALEFIPVAGPIIGGALILGVAFFSNYNHLLWLFIFLLVWRGIQDYVTSPRIMGRQLQLHPLAVLFGILAGGEVAGVIGVFLSIPVLAGLRILFRTFDHYRTSTSSAAD